MAKQAKRSFQYQRRSAEDVQKRANAKGGNFDSYIKSDFKVYKIKDGKNVLRIMPPTWEGARHYGYDLWVNYGIGVDNSSYLSLSKMLNEKDPLAEARRLADKDGDEEMAKALAPKQRIGMWVIDREAEDEGPQIFICPWTVDKDIALISVDDDTGEVVMIDDPEEGCDLRFYREGKGRNTKYPAAKMRLLKPSYLSENEDKQAEWLEYIQDHPIPDCLQYYTYDQIAEAFGGNVRTADKDDDGEKPRRGRGNRDDDDGGERRPSHRSRERDEDETPRRRPTSRTAPDDDEETLPWKGRGNGKDEEGDEEESPPPRRGGASRASRESDAEEAPPPRESRGRASGNRRPVEDRSDEGDGSDEAPPPRESRRSSSRDEAEEAPPRRRQAREEEPPPRSSRRAPPREEEAYEDADDDDTRAPPPRAGGIRERIAQRARAGGSKSRED